MAGKIIADTLETGAGSDIATSYVVNGSAKAWVNFDGTASGAASRDSFNVSSMTDNSTGNHTVTNTNALSDSNYSVGSSYNAGEKRAMGVQDYTSSTHRVIVWDYVSGFSDRDTICTQIFGDLA
jgi:hypothetical protein